MFKNLVDLGYKRTPKEAIGFYLAYLLLNIVIGAVLGGVFHSGNSISSSFSSGVLIGQYGTIITQLIIGILILSKRKRYKSFTYIIIVLLSILLSEFGGALVGLIPLAYLTTKGSK